MNEFFANPWVVGIGGGIISGIVIFFFSNWVMNKKNNKEHIIQIEYANLEVISILKPYIADKVLPNIDIINAICLSVCRKYNIKRNEMFSVSIFCQELIKEIIENVYVSCDKKEEYTNQLSNYILNLKKIIPKEKEDEYTRIKADAKFRQNIIRQFSLILATITAAIITFLTAITSFKNKSALLNLISLESNNIDIWLLIILICPITLVMLERIIIFKEKHLKEKRSENTKSFDSYKQK